MKKEERKNKERSALYPWIPWIDNKRQRHPPFTFVLFFFYFLFAAFTHLQLVFYFPMIASASHRRRQSALVYSTSKLDGSLSPNNRLGPDHGSTSLINSPSSPSISQHHNQTLQPPTTPRYNSNNNISNSNNNDEATSRNSLGIWTGSKSAASTPNLVGNVGRSPTANFSSSSITVGSNNSMMPTQAQVQAGADSGASMDSQTSPSFQQRRKRSESTGGFKVSVLFLYNDEHTMSKAH